MGKGSGFTALFPGIQPGLSVAVGTARKAPPRASPDAPRTVLVIDDQELVLNVARSMLQAAGYAVRTAADGEEGLRILEEGTDEIAAVLLDLSMPRMSGLEVFQHIRASHAALPIVLSSGYSEPESIAPFPGDPRLSFIQKPYEFRELVNKIRTALSPAPAGEARVDAGFLGTQL